MLLDGEHNSQAATRAKPANLVFYFMFTVMTCAPETT